MTYKITRFYEDDRPSETIDSGLTLDEAHTHCRSEDTHGITEDGVRWFDGYEEE